MKQVIVLVAMIVLGVAIAGMVLQFRTSATTITNSANQKILNDVIPTSQLTVPEGELNGWFAAA
ncbi:MAG: hypothetical protein J6E42_08275 [Firmicutes bacterium]|nr:hypothetical protein [Bacillota bacterium]